MPSRLELLVDLLHCAAEAALATHSVALPGHPFASAVPFAVDARQRPVMLLSALAEHSRNLAANPRASLLVARQLGAGEMARVSLVGELVPIDAPPLLVARYLRYQPHAARFLQLGDFRFHRFEPSRVLVVGGFAKAGWLEGSRLIEAPHVTLEDEAAALAAAAPHCAAGTTLLGVDAHGADLLDGAGRRRIRYAAGPVTADALVPGLLRAIAALGQDRDAGSR